MNEFRKKGESPLRLSFTRLSDAARLIFLFLVLSSGLASADNMRVELVGGKVEPQNNGDVVLVLQIAPIRINSITGMGLDDLKTWSEVRRREPYLRDILTQVLSLREYGKDTPPTEVTFPEISNQLDSAALPPFISVNVVWKNVGLIHTSFVPNSITAKPNPGGQILMSLVLEENVPWWRSMFRAVLIGFEHIVPFGLDHILFVLGIYLAASRFRDLLWQVTSFTVAHSLTLGLTMSRVIVVGPFWEQFVEIGIAVSIFFVAFENCWSRRPAGWRRILVVGGFGLVHGMGFAGRLAEVKWPPGTFLFSLFSANLGIELGQLAVIGAASLVTAWWWKFSWYQSRIAIPISLLIGLYGMFAALERISQFGFPKKEVLDFLWSLYDRYYWAVPICIGTITLVILWIVYRVILMLCHRFIPRPPETVDKQNENAKNPTLNQVNG